MEDIKMSAMKAQYAKLKPELDAAFTAVMESGAFGGGPQVGSFAKALTQYVSVQHAIPCATGADAYRLAFAALDLPNGAEIVMPAFMDNTAVDAALDCGLIPVFADVLPDAYTLDPASVKEVLTRNSRALMPVHVFGQCAPMEELTALATQHHLQLIEDASHALGTVYTDSDQKNAKAGSMGHVSITSFFPSKPLAGSGEGAAVLTNDPVLARKMKDLLETTLPVGMDALQAAMLEVKLKHLEEFNEGRQVIAKYYNSAFAATDLVKAPERAAYSSHIYQQYAITVAPEIRDGLQAYLREQHIPSEVYYPQPLHLQQRDKASRFVPNRLPVAAHLAKSILSLPMHALLSEEKLAYICQHVIDYVQQKAS